MSNTVTVIVARHGKYNRSIDSATSGHLTEEGIEGIKRTTMERLAKTPEAELEKTRFFVVGSTTFWLDNPAYGQRGLETEKVIEETIKWYFKSKGIDSSRCFLTYKDFSQKRFGQKKDSRRVLRKVRRNALREPNIYQKVPEYIKKLKLKHNGMTREFFEEMTSSDEAKLYDPNAETGKVVRDKLRRILKKILNKVIKISRRNNCNICVILVTHGENIRALTNNTKFKLRKGEEIPYNQGIVLTHKNGNVTVEPEYPLQYPLRGVDGVDRDL